MEMASLLDEALAPAGDLVAAREEGKERLSDDEYTSEDDTVVDDTSLDTQAQSVVTILIPVAITMLLVIIAVRSIHVTSSSVSVAMLYHESASDSTGTKFFGSLLNALVFVVIITVTTILFVILYKYRCMKILYGWLMTSTGLMLAFFGGGFLSLLLTQKNIPLDYISIVFIVWNFAVAGILSIFWNAPPIVNQTYLVLISALMAIFFTFLPEWTTWAILAAIAIYDVFAVLCPKGPLRLLVETSQQRQEVIPALLYNGMARTRDGAGGVYTDSDDDDDADDDGEDEDDEYDEQEEPLVKEPKSGVKLGLGDFVFYSVLLGRAALFDMITVVTCFIAIITGLFGTLILLAIFKKALPALPFSIALGMMFFFLTRFFVVPFVLLLGANGVFF